MKHKMSTKSDARIAKCLSGRLSKIQKSAQNKGLHLTQLIMPHISLLYL